LKDLNFVIYKLYQNIMKKTGLFLTLAALFSFSVLFVQCAGDADDVKDSARDAISNQAPAAQQPATPAAQQPVEPAAPSGPATTIAFATETHDFGTIKAGEKAEHVFTFTNTGDEPLIISNAKGSCGCTVPNWPRNPIPPGASDEIKVVFDSKNRTGNQSNRVTITANTNPPQTFLTMRGVVEAAN
jgi:hypothetical protein